MTLQKSLFPPRKENLWYVQRVNGVMICDLSMPPSVDEFSEDFAGYPITSLGLDILSRDLTAFLTELGLVSSTRMDEFIHFLFPGMSCEKYIVARSLMKEPP